MSLCLWGHSAITQPNLSSFICEVTIQLSPTLTPGICWLTEECALGHSEVSINMESLKV